MLGKRSEQDSVKEAYDMRGSKPVQALWFVCGCSQQPDGKVPLLKEIIETPPNPQRFHLRENDPRYFWRFWRNILDRPGHEQFPVSIECRPVCPAYVCWVVYSIISYYFFVTALSLSTSLNPLCCWGSNFLAGRKGSQVFGAVWEAQKRAAWQDWTRISPYISWTISGMLRLENAQNAACCHLLPSHSAGTFFEVLEPRPWLTIVTTSWR